MDVLFSLVALSLVLVAAIGVVLVWAVRAGQFEDLEGPAWRVLEDDDGPGARSSGASQEGSDRVDPDQSGRN